MCKSSLQFNLGPSGPFLDRVQCGRSEERSPQFLRQADCATRSPHQTLLSPLAQQCFNLPKTDTNTRYLLGSCHACHDGAGGHQAVYLPHRLRSLHFKMTRVPSRANQIPGIRQVVACYRQVSRFSPGCFIRFSERALLRMPCRRDDLWAAVSVFHQYPAGKASIRSDSLEQRIGL
jgi:hypothetical protein